MSDFAHLQSLTTIPRDPRTRAPLTTLGSRYKILDASQLLQVQKQFQVQKRKIHLSKTTKADKQRHLRSQGILPPKSMSQQVFGGGGEKTYDVGVVSRAKKRAAVAGGLHHERFMTEQEESTVEALQETLAQNAKKLHQLRRKINAMTNDKTELAGGKAKKKKKKKLFSEKTGGSLPGSNASSRTSLSSSTRSTSSTSSTRSTSSSNATNENQLNGTVEGDEEEDGLFDSAMGEGGDEQLPAGVLAMMADGDKWHAERVQKVRTNSGLKSQYIGPYWKTCAHYW